MRFPLILSANVDAAVCVVPEIFFHFKPWASYDLQDFQYLAVCQDILIISGISFSDIVIVCNSTFIMYLYYLYMVLAKYSCLIYVN